MMYSSRPDEYTAGLLDPKASLVSVDTQKEAPIVESSVESASETPVDTEEPEHQAEEIKQHPEEQTEEIKQPEEQAEKIKTPPTPPKIPNTPLAPYDDTKPCALQVIDLSMNHLQTLYHAQETTRLSKIDFLPVATDVIYLRFRLAAAPGATADHASDMAGYQILAQVGETPVWDSGPVHVTTMPTEIVWDAAFPEVGSVVQWQVLVWDKAGTQCQPAESIFAMGPTEWDAPWQVHQDDYQQFQHDITQLHWTQNIAGCQYWKKRRPLPLFRTQFVASKPVQTALLVVSGLGAYRATINGQELSEATLEPTLTDYSQRIFYRAFQVPATQFVDSKIVLGMTMGSGWLDSRPLTGGMIPLHYLSRGAVTATAQLYITYQDGSKETLQANWQVTKGFVRDAEMYTGDTIDLGMQKAMEGWDTVQGFESNSATWQPAIDYQPGNTTEQWRAALHKIGVERNEDHSGIYGMAPLGKLLPSEAPPIMPLEKIPVESMWQLSEGRWILDFGKAMSGVIRFENGLPEPFIPSDGYPRGHYVNSTVNPDERYITVLYGENIQSDTGKMGIHITAAHGLHDGPGYPQDTPERAGPCFQRDMGNVALQRDVFVIGKNYTNEGSFANARQSLFTTHGFRFAEVCCTKEPPKDAYAMLYRTAVQEWGEFSSSNVLLNGAHELTRNAFVSNMLGVQSDCPHREKLQYGGDILANSPAALHLFDNGAFYGKIIRDFQASQWSNGAYTEMSSWLNMLQEFGIGKGAGETIWAACPPVLTARHFQHYGDMDLVRNTFDSHNRWIDFLGREWERGMNEKFPDLNNIGCCDKGLSDWLSLYERDTYLGHQSYYMASARSVVYLAEQQKRVGNKDDGLNAVQSSARQVAAELVTKMNDIYMKEDAFRIKKHHYWTPGPDLGLFARIVPGPKRCVVLENFARQAGKDDRQGWPGIDEEKFYQQLNEVDREDHIARGVAGPVDKEDNELGKIYEALYSPRHSMFEGIFAVRYTLKALSDMGLHKLALSKTTSTDFGSFEWMLSFNATTLWETWYMSEHVYSRNHPMLGSVAEWLASSVAGVSLHPRTSAGKELLFWPRFSHSAHILQHAGATQGTKRGDAAFAWQFQDLPDETTKWDNGTATIQATMLVPPASLAELQLPKNCGEIELFSASRFPDIKSVRAKASEECTSRRKERQGYDWNWEFNLEEKKWHKRKNPKSIGTPCHHFLLHKDLDEVDWNALDPFRRDSRDSHVYFLQSGLYRVVIKQWKLTSDLPENGYLDISREQLGEYCANEDTFTWDELDATHLI